MYNFIIFILLISYSMSWAQLPVGTTIDDFFMPGSQPPDESGTISKPTDCGCHTFNGDYTYSYWRSSMMAHAVMDPLFTATMVIANQDAVDAGDLCLRCHTPTGWLQGRSVPTNGSSLEITSPKDDDASSVNCKFCHRSVHPTPLGVNPYADPLDTVYFNNTYSIDQTYLSSIADIPPTSANGMYVVDDLNGTRRGPYLLSSTGNHDKLYSPFHRDAALCGTCHDVSNPVYSRSLSDNKDYILEADGNPANSFDPYDMFPVERTYSEWLNSDFNTPDGSTCQGCHMPPVIAGLTNSSKDTLMGIHEMAGGNTFVPLLLSTMDQTEKDSSIARATRMLQSAATLQVSVAGKTITVTVTNNTGHKLPSGYPEGRRMWLNVQAFDALDNIILNSGSYDFNTGDLTHDPDIKVYEIKPGLSSYIAGATGLTAGPSFHFALNDTIYNDNRIPPRGFTNANFEAIQSPPVGYTYADGQYDDVTTYTIEQIPDSVIVILYYQTTSKEYVTFLKDNNTTDSKGTDMYNFWDTNGKSAPVVMAQQTLGTNDIPLHVNFSNLMIEMGDKYPVLKWNTESETENLGFIVYRREESETLFSEIASYKTNDDLNGLGNSSHSKEYFFIDSDVALIRGRTYLYKVADVDFSGKVTEHGAVSIIFAPGKIASKFVLKGNYPNPFNGETYIDFFISQKQPIAIYIYNTAGELVRSLNNFLYYSGDNRVKWDSRDNNGNSVPSGVYFYSLKTRNEKKTGKMILIK